MKRALIFVSTTIIVFLQVVPLNTKAQDYHSSNISDTLWGYSIYRTKTFNNKSKYEIRVSAQYSNNHRINNVPNTVIRCLSDKFISHNKSKFKKTKWGWIKRIIVKTNKPIEIGIEIRHNGTTKVNRATLNK